MHALKRRALTIAAIAITTGVALAGEKPNFDDADRNGDGRVSIA